MKEQKENLLYGIVHNNKDKKKKQKIPLFTSWRLVIIPIIHIHGMCLFLTWRGSQGLRHGTHWWSIIGYWCSSHLHLFSTLSPRVRLIVFAGRGFWLNPGPSEAGFIMRYGDLKAFDVFPLPFHISLNLLSRRFVRLYCVSLREVFKLSLESSQEPLDIVQ